MRNYIGLPNPDTQPEEFNQYLRVHNIVITESSSWILIQNSYIENQLVLFAKDPIKYLGQLDWTAFKQLKMFLANYQDNEVYINPDERKSVHNRLHIHIKL